MSENRRSGASRASRVERIFSARDADAADAGVFGGAHAQVGADDGAEGGAYGDPYKGGSLDDASPMTADAPAYDETDYAPNEAAPYQATPFADDIADVDHLADAYAPTNAGYPVYAGYSVDAQTLAADAEAMDDASYTESEAYVDDAAYRDEAYIDEAAYPDDPSAYPADALDPLDDVAPYAAPVYPVADSPYSAYYRGGAAQAGDELTEPAYAPPSKLPFAPYGAQAEPWPDTDEQPERDPSQPSVNVYRPREATWADTARQQVLADHDLGYQVSDTEPDARAGRKHHWLRIALIALAVVCLLGGAAYLWREPLAALVRGAEQATEAPYTAVTTPGPVKGYDEAPKTAVSARAQQEIGALAGDIDLQTRTVTEHNVLTREMRADGLCDYYLFNAEGGLLCYFEGLGENDMIPMASGGFYVRQSPYLVAMDGSPLVRLDALEREQGMALEPQQMLNGLAIVRDTLDDSGNPYNYLDASGQLVSRLWFARAYPLTGERTVAYADTGAVGSEDRYLLYALDAQGDMTKLADAPDMGGVVASACGAAYMSTGELVWLGTPDEPMLVTGEVTFYPDCDAMVARGQDAQGNARYGLYVHGEKRYDFQYDEIKPVECDLVWAQKTYGADAGRATVRVVSGAEYPQPLSYYFELTQNGQKQYVALSAATNSPILLDGQP